MSRLKETYEKKIIADLKKELGINNSFALPRLEKVVINVGTGQAKTNAKFADVVTETLTSISGQKPAVRRAKKAISGFKTREGDQVGLMVTLRKDRMYDFTDKLANIVLPRLRDFRGLDEKSFDQKGSFTLGIGEQIIFPEITHEKSEVIHGMSITFVTTAKSSKEGHALMKALGFPFKKSQVGKEING
jgi:large subunit ribosomal protein L5